MSGDGRLVLVVDDEPDIVDLVTSALRRAGYETEAARNGDEALGKIRERTPDLVLLDIMMPERDGWSVLRALKEDDELAKIEVVMLTALSQERDVIRGHFEGAVNYITKPFEMDELLRTVQTNLKSKTPELLEERRTKVRELLTRLMELESGRSARNQVLSSSLPSRPAGPPPATDAEKARLHGLTPTQRQVAEFLADEVPVTTIAEKLDVSRTNVYAVRKRIAKRLGVSADDVATEVRRLRT